VGKGKEIVPKGNEGKGKLEASKTFQGRRIISQSLRTGKSDLRQGWGCKKYRMRRGGKRVWKNEEKGVKISEGRKITTFRSALRSGVAVGIGQTSSQY